jgi:hypothetical protein
MKKINVFLILILFGFGVVVQSAQSIEITRAPHLGSGQGLKPSFTTGPSHNARLAFSPYAQVVPGNSYTFIGVSHPSLSTAHTSIGLVIEAMDMTFTTSGTNPLEEARAVIFTIDAGTTHRVFIVDEGHATINSSNAAFTGANTHIIATATGATQFGNIRVTSIGTNPGHNTHAGARYDKGAQTSYQSSGADCETATVTASCIQRFDNLNQLAMWGVVYQESNGAGFSLEFIGDMHDSSAAGTRPQTAIGGGRHAHQVSSDGMGFGGAGRGIN